jgi:hypothetical protein
MNADEFEDEDLATQILEKGDEVFSLVWDGGAPGLSGGFWISAWNGKFALGSTDHCDPGPYDSLGEALDSSELLLVSSATASIDCDLLSATELAQRLECHEEEEFDLLLNGERWIYDGHGKFRPSPEKQRGEEKETS